MRKATVILGILALSAFSVAGYLLSTKVVQAHMFPAPVPTVGYVDGWDIRNEGNVLGKTAYISGWAYDPLYANESVFVVLSTTDTIITQEDALYWDATRNARPDVAAAFGLTSDRVGFQIPIPRELYDGASHTIYVWSSNTIEDCRPRGCEPINKNTGQTLIGTVEFTGLNGGIHGALDTVEGNTAYGWAFDADGYRTAEEHTAVLFYVCDDSSGLDEVCRDKRYIGGGFTGVVRLDVAAAFSDEEVGEEQGFAVELTIPEDLRDGYGGHDIVAFAVSYTDRSMVQLPGMIERTFNEDGSLSE